MLFTLTLTRHDGSNKNVVARGYTLNEASKMLCLHDKRPEVRYALNHMNNNLYQVFGWQFDDPFHYSGTGFQIDLTIQNAWFATILDNESVRAITVLEDTPAKAALKLVERVLSMDDETSVEMSQPDFAILHAKISEVLLTIAAGSDEVERDVIGEGMSDLNLTVVFKGYK